MSGKSANAPPKVRDGDGGVLTLVQQMNTHIFARFNTLDKMSHEELMNEIEVIAIIEDRDSIYRRYEQTRSKAKRILENPELVQLIPDEKPYIWERLKELATMPCEKLIQEEEADFVLSLPLREFIPNSEWKSYSLEKKHDVFRDELKDINKQPELVHLVPGERLHIWRRLDELNNMSREELMNELEVGIILDSLD